MAWCRIGDKPLSVSILISNSLTHICGTRGELIINIPGLLHLYKGNQAIIPIVWSKPEVLWLDRRHLTATKHNNVNRCHIHCGCRIIPTVTSQERHGISSHRRLLILQKLLQAKKQENIKAPHYWPFVKGIQQWPMVCLHKGPLIRIACLCHDVIMTSAHPSSHISFTISHPLSQ